MRNPNRTAAERRAKALSDENQSDTLIIYNSSNGSTMQYASWLSDVLDCDVANYSKQNIAYASLYKKVIFIGWLRAGEITRLMVLRQNYDNFSLSEKELFVVAVGIGPIESKDYIRYLRKRNGCESSKIHFYYIPGRYDPSKVKGVDKASVKAMANSMFDGMSEEEAALFSERLSQGFNGLSPEHLKPIVEDVLKS